MSNDWAGLRAATVTPRRRNSPSRRVHTQVLPTSVAVPHTSTRRSGRTLSSIGRGPGRHLDMDRGWDGSNGAGSAGQTQPHQLTEQVERLIGELVGLGLA